MRQFALSNLSGTRATTTEMPVGIFRCAALGFVALLAVALMIMPIGVGAQLAGKGAITGTVQDKTGAVIGNATVTATNNANGVSTVTKSNGAGDYNFPDLDPGIYTVTTIAPGFEKLTQENVHVDA